MSTDIQELSNMPDLTEKDLKTILPRDDSFTPPRILIMCPDKALAPYAASEPWNVFKKAGCVIEFATETGEIPKADQRMLERSKFRDFLDIAMENIELFYAMAGSDEYLSPRSWSEPGFSLLPYDAVYLTTGFDTRMRQFVESESLHKLMASYFPLSKRRTAVQRAQTLSDKIKRRSTMLQDAEEHLPSVITEKHHDELSHLEGPRKVVGAMGKGVLVLSRSMVVDNLTPEERKSAEEQCTQSRDAFVENKIKEEAEEAERKKMNRRSTALGFGKKADSLQRSNTTGGFFKSSKAKEESQRQEELQKSLPSPSLSRSVIYGVETTTTPSWMENVGTTITTIHGFKNMFKTYQKSTQEQVVKALGNSTLFHAGPPKMKQFTHSASTHHYVSARYPRDGRLISLHLLEEIALARKEWAKVRLD
ncbi:hypothetical protein TWF694_006965 [Orbilia ellipsospora]|uniref:Uncharacterized protein n=1 Tax=Orbilia ellipsospora TaxID=2528407 RepID=A0AAV9XLS0_9PEZI